MLNSSVIQEERGSLSAQAYSSIIMACKHIVSRIYYLGGNWETPTSHPQSVKPELTSSRPSHRDNTTQCCVLCSQQSAVPTKPAWANLQTTPSVPICLHLLYFNFTKYFHKILFYNLLGTYSNHCKKEHYHMLTDGQAMCFDIVFKLFR